MQLTSFPRRPLTRILVAALAAAVPGAVASAQDAEPPAMQVTTIEVAPASMGSFRDAIRKMAAAAKAANLPAAEVGWWSLNEGNRIIMIRPHANDELFSNTQLRQKIAKANPDADKEIGAALQTAQILGITTEIVQAVPALRYQPAQPMDSALGATVTTDYTILPDQGSAFDEAIQATNKALAQIHYPYERIIVRVRMGTRRTQLITFIDSRENYYGKNWVPRLWEGNPAAREALVAARQALLKTVGSIRTTVQGYSAAQSYPPPQQ
jgi:hypothetical protein